MAYAAVSSAVSFALEYTIPSVVTQDHDIIGGRSFARHFNRMFFVAV